MMVVMVGSRSQAGRTVEDLEVLVYLLHEPHVMLDFCIPKVVLVICT
jgi:hypothetical protein